MRACLIGTVLSMCVLEAAVAVECLVFNPTGREYTNHAVRLSVPPPGDAFVVKRGDREIPWQVETLDGKPWIWVLDSFAPRSSNRYEVVSGSVREAPPPAVTLEQAAPSTQTPSVRHWVLDNGVVALRTPIDVGGALTGPISGVRLPDGRWVGRSSWMTDLRLRHFEAEAFRGCVFAKVRLRYTFESRTPAFSEIEVKLAPGWHHAAITERHQMPSGSYWEFAAADGWSLRDGRSVWFRTGPGGPPPGLPKPNRPLTVGALPLHDPELYIVLLPRWDQSFRDGWFFAATDGEHCVGAMTCKAGRWRWPHDNGVRVMVKASGDYAGFRCPTRHGARYWWLTVGTTNAPVGHPSVPYIKEHGFEDLDKLNHEFVLSWPGKSPGWWSMFPYRDWDINPTSGVRRFGREAAKKAGRTGGVRDLIEVQYRLHPDTYGSYWHYCSPENPNFFTDFIKLPFAKITTLKQHPRFKDFCVLAEQKLREDIYHSITMPGGAGQECPGYMALRTMKTMAELGKEHLGFDLTGWDRLEAGFRFQRRISQPRGTQRIFLPMGDTHPAGDGPRSIEVSAEEVKRFTTAELPGFGVVFNGKPGTPQESYLAFKAGPNRGHYHGDQLSFHYGANAYPAAVDHHCSYSPRAAQEHMHNRVAFFTGAMPWANMGGFERLIAFKTSPQVDIAVGQVESKRLREIVSLPPSQWHREWPVHRLDGTLTYRRTIVFVKGAVCDYFVIRDQFSAPETVGAAFCLHVDDPDTVAYREPLAGSGEGSATCTDADGERGGSSSGTNIWYDANTDFKALGVTPGWALHTGRTRGGKSPWIRQVHYLVTEVRQHELVVDRTIPTTQDFPYLLYRPQYTVDGQAVRFARMTLFRALPANAELKFFPWSFAKAGGQATTGIRLETQGRRGEFVTVLAPGAAVPAMAGIPGGVKVGLDEIVFSGGISEEAGTTYVSVFHGGQPVLSLSGTEIDLNRFQGDVGLCVLNVGQNYGEMPDWLIRQRTSQRPAWYRDAWPAGPRSPAP